MVSFSGDSVCYLSYLKGLVNKIGGGNGDMFFFGECVFAGLKVLGRVRGPGRS